MRKSNRRPKFHTLAAVFALWGNQAMAAGLGPLEVQSTLGESFRARVALIGDNPSEFAEGCVKARVETLSGDLLSISQVSIHRTPGANFLQLSTKRVIDEPAVQVNATLHCGAVITRNYQVLLDLPSRAVSSTVRAGASGLTTYPLQPPGLPGVVVQPGSSGSKPVQKRTEKQKSAESVEGSHGESRGRKPKSLVRVPAADALVLSAPHDVNATDHTLSGLKLGLSLSLSSADVAQGHAEAIHAQFLAALQENGDGPLPLVMRSTLQKELEAAKRDSARWQQQLVHEKSATQASRQSLTQWIEILGGGLVFSLGLTAWLAWRYTVVQRQRTQGAWYRTTGDDNTSIFADEPFLAEDYASKDDVRAAHNAAHPLKNHGDAAFLVQEDEAGPTVAAKQDGVALADKAPTSNQVRMAEALQRPLAPYIYTHFADYAEEPLLGNKKPLQLVAEEVSDLLEVIEMWTALDQADKALELLKPYGDIKDPTSPVPWIGLLQVYHALGDQENYEAIAVRLKSVFNVKTPQWDQRSEWDLPKSLTNFPHVKQRIIDLWRSPELVPYLNSLILDDRGGDRSGFDVGVFKDLLKLLQLAQNPERLQGAQTLVDGEAYAILFAESKPASGIATVPFGDMEVV